MLIYDLVPMKWWMRKRPTKCKVYSSLTAEAPSMNKVKKKKNKKYKHFLPFLWMAKESHFFVCSAAIASFVYRLFWCLTNVAHCMCSMKINMEWFCANNSRPKVNKIKSIYGKTISTLLFFNCMHYILFGRYCLTSANWGSYVNFKALATNGINWFCFCTRAELRLSLSLLRYVRFLLMVFRSRCSLLCGTCFYFIFISVFFRCCCCCLFVVCIPLCLRMKR